MNEKFTLEPAIKIMPITPDWLNNPNPLKKTNPKLAEAIIEFTTLRGWILNRFLEVEAYLDLIICYGLFGQNEKKRNLFRDILLDKPFSTFGHKYEMVESLLAHKKNLFSPVPG